MLFPPNALPDGPHLETQKALLLLDFQNDFLSTKGHLFVPNTNLFLPKLPDLIAKFRENGQIVWSRTEYTHPRESFSPFTGADSILLKSVVQQQAWQSQFKHHNFGQPPIQEEAEDSEDNHEADGQKSKEDPEAFLASGLAATFKRCCQPGTSGAEIPAKLAQSINKAKDVIIVKYDYSAFADPSLLLQLRMRLITDLYVCGSLSNITVYATVLDAVRNGFNVTLIEDCLGYRDEDCHIAAMRDMADGLGARGIDFQELMDDLAGLLGDVIDESQFTRTFQLSVTPATDPPRSRASSQRLSEWIDSVEDDTDSFTTALEHQSVRATTPQSQVSDPAQQRHRSVESPVESRVRAMSPGVSPSRKRRAVSEQDSQRNNRNHTSSKSSSARRASYDGFGTQLNSVKKQTSRNSAIYYGWEPSGSKSVSPDSQKATLSQPSANIVPDLSLPAYQGNESDQSQTPKATTFERNRSPATQGLRTKKAKSGTKIFMGPTDTIGDGDCSLVLNAEKEPAGKSWFHTLKTKTKWQKMYHRSGEVPRLVAVQGNVDSDGTIPVYRHPADESPELLPFDDAVLSIKTTCENLVGHPLNHVLVQYYRSGEDNISEHSDKTLDIAHDSKIVNVSFGATRTMTLRTKKFTPGEASGTGEKEIPRITQHIRLPNASAFILGPISNANWLHSIRPDKRPDSEKTKDECLQNGERVSLTFRHIATFIDPKRNLIWGQGATAKTKDEASPILSGEEAANEGEKLIIGFGKENHQNDESFDWDKVYGTGFDVVNFVTRPVD